MVVLLIVVGYNTDRLQSNLSNFQIMNSLFQSYLNSCATNIIIDIYIQLPNIYYYPEHKIYQTLPFIKLYTSHILFQKCVHHYQPVHGHYYHQSHSCSTTGRLGFNLLILFLASNLVT